MAGRFRGMRSLPSTEEVEMTVERLERLGKTYRSDGVQEAVRLQRVVGAAGFEPATLSSQS